MATTLSQALGYIGVGDLYFQEVADDGTISPDMVEAGNGTVFELSSDSNIEKQISRKRLTAGQVLATATQNQPPKCSIKLQTINVENLRRLWLGTQEALTQASGLALAAVTTALSKTGWRQITKTVSNVTTDLRNLDTAVTLTDSAATKTYVEGTDYEVDRWSGLIRALSSGTIADADLATCKLTCTTKAIDGARVLGGTKPSIKVRVHFLGLNTVDNSRSKVTLWAGTLKPKGGIDLLSDKWAEAEYEIELTTPAGKASPFIYEQY
jgi:hypothetical protein